MSSTTQNTQKWQPVGTAARVHDAIRFDVVAERGRGVYHIGAEHVGALFDGHPVPVVTMKKNREPEHAGHIERSKSGRMLMCQLVKDGASFQAPTAALRAHYDENHGTPTTLIIPPGPDRAPEPEPVRLPKGIRPGVCA
jgi:hypothetical protein